jgi:hypothetical protein
VAAELFGPESEGHSACPHVESMSASERSRHVSGECPRLIRTNKAVMQIRASAVPIGDPKGR